MWRTKGPGRTSSTAAQACDILVEHLPDPSSFTFIDACAGAGGPTPILEASLNEKLEARGQRPVPFILADLYPDFAAWRKIVAKSENITYVEVPVDATKATRYSTSDRKECRMFNLCFHHFEDEAASAVLRSAVASADAFAYVTKFIVLRKSFIPPLFLSLFSVGGRLANKENSIFEMTQRNVSALLNTTIVILSPLITTLLWFWYSPLHIIFTYLIPIVPLFFAIDGYVSCLRTRTPGEVYNLLHRHPDLNLDEWEFKSGETKVLPPFGNLYWFIGVRKTI